ncbi:MAG: oligosaccharide flippase family protein [Kofleriaceae bacterium]
MVDRSLVARSTAWVAAASGMLGVLDLVTTLLCVRLWVTKADFGAATLAIALFPILDRLGGMGFGTALVREPEAEHTVFWLNLATALAVLAALLGVHPVLAHAFDPPIVASLLAAYGVRLVIQTGSVVPEARMKRALRFHELSLIRVTAGIAETITKLGLAYRGEHIWCFAAGPIVNTAVTTLAIQLRSPWRPRAVFDRAIARRALGFTAALSGGELLYYVYTSADYLVIGATFGDAAVGVYRLAYELVLDVVRLISMITNEVAYPVLVQTERGELARVFLRFTRQNALLLAPFLVVVAIAGGPLLTLLYGPMPDSAATAARILCVVGGLRALGFVIPPLLAALGRTSRVLVYNAVAAVVLPAAFVIAARVGSDYTAIAWAWAIGYPIAFAVLLAFALAALPLSLGGYLRGLLRRQ